MPKNQGQQKDTNDQSDGSKRDKVQNHPITVFVPQYSMESFCWQVNPS